MKIDTRPREAVAADKHDRPWSDVGRPVPRAAVVATHLVPLTVLPAGIWRILLGCGLTMGFTRAQLEADGFPGWGTAMVVFLTAVTEALALLTFALVRPWGEVVPAWVPRLGGRRIPPAAVFIPAAVGGVLLNVLWIYAEIGLFTGRVDDFAGGNGWWVLMVACYLPALLWGPLLLLVTYLYRRRRRAA